MNRIRIKDVDIEWSLHPDIWKIEEKGTSQLATVLLQQLSKTTLFEQFAINKIQILPGNRVIYQIPVPEKKFPIAPKTDKDFESFLNRTIALATAISEVHKAEYCFGVLQNSRFMVDSDGKLLITGLGLFQKEYAKSDLAAYQDDDFFFMAPEFSTRSKQRPDFKADLYGFGALMHYWLSGEHFFKAVDKQEVLHKHLTEPYDASINTLWKHTGIHQIINALLEKKPENRCQSAQGVLRDLENLKHQFGKGEFDVSPELSINFNPGVIRISDTILEQEAALQQLMKVYRDVRNGPASVAFVEGAAGIGKTSLAKAFEAEITDSDTLFTVGSFDKSQSTPYSAFQKAFKNIAQRILLKSGKSHSEIRDIFINGLGSDLSALFEVIPDLKELTGKLPEPESLNPLETGDRFVNLFARYCRTLDGIGLKRVIFIDDVQWSDLSSLKLIEYMAWAPLHRVLFVLSYNPEGLTEDHPLLKFQRSLVAGKKNVPVIRLSPLSQKATEQVVADALSEEQSKIHDLAVLVHKKTNGNPYYIKHFLYSLHENKALTYDTVAQRWQYNLSSVKQQDVAENLLAIYEKQLSLQSYQAQVILKIAAFDNGNFNIPLLISMSGFPQEIVVLLLELLTEAGQISKLDATPNQFVFNHNKIQQAALHLAIPGFDVSFEELHYGIALFHMKNNGIVDAISLNQFVEHLISSGAHIQDNIVPVALGYILEAAQLANNSNSALTAKQNLSFALDLQTKFRTDRYAYEVLFEMAKASYLLKQVEEGRVYADRAINNAPDDYKKCEVHLLNLTFLEAYSLYKSNTQEGIKALKVLGSKMNLFSKPSETKSAYLKFMEVLPTDFNNDLLGSAVYTKEDRYALEIMVNMCTSAKRIDQNLYTHLLFAMGELMFKNGFTDSSPFILVHLGSFLCHRYHEFELGEKLSSLGLKRLQSEKPGKYFSKTMSVYHMAMGPLMVDYQTLETQLDEAIAYNVDRGDFYGASSLQYAQIRNQLLSGTNLLELLRVCNETIDSFSKHGNTVHLAQIQGIKFILQRLIGNDTGTLNTATKVMQLLEDSNCRTAIASFHIFLGWVDCIKGDYQKALAHFKDHQKELEHLISEPQFFKYQVLRSVCELMVNSNPTSKVLGGVKERQKQLSGWAKAASHNFWAEYQMVELLLACKSGDCTNMSEQIEYVLLWTQKNGQFHIRAMFCDIISSALPKKGFVFIKQALKNESEKAKAGWGIPLQGNEFDGNFEEKANTHSQHIKNFDFQSLIKATQTISAEVNRDRLVESLLQIVMENAGADKGALVLRNGTSLHVTAFIDLTVPTEAQFSESPLEDCRTLPISLIEHVATTKNELCIDDLTEYCANSEDLTADFKGSLLLLPLIKQRDLVGVLYIANSHITGMFTEGGLEVLRIVAAQAAISITNSTLYEQAVTLNNELAASQKELAKLNQALEEKIKNRTQHLRHEIEMRKEAERDLIFAKNDADNANRAKSQFLANMSHEIRTPLNAIVGFSQILTNQSKSLDLTNSFRRYLNNIHQSAETLSEIIQDILDLSKIEAGKTALLQEDMDLRQLFFSVYRIQKSMAKSKDVKVIYGLSPGTPRYVRSDRGKIKQILMNIVGNAVKFTPASKNVHLDLRVDNDFLIFRVADEGIGIPQKDLERIFEPFTQSDAGKDRKYGGTGLGLAITKSLVDILKGELSVESTEGEGTIFTIKIPYLKATPMPFDNPETIMANYRIPSKSKILVVEDQLMNQEMIRALFAELGSEILLASNGREGVAMAKQYDPDIIFMDIHMPEIDGFETLKLIRGFNLDIPIIGLSADAFKEHQDAAVEAGFTAYLTKPVNVPKLVGLLKSFLPEVSCTTSTGKTVLNDDQQHQKEQALETLRKLPIFETEKLAAVAESLSEILPAGILNKLEDAIYTGDEVALQNFLTNTLNV